MTDVFYRSPAQEYPIIDRAHGIYLWDTDGRQYLDGSSGALVVNVGHGREQVIQAMADQARRVAFAHTSRFTSEAQERLGESIRVHLPAWQGAYSYFVSGGSEAVETAIKMARQYHVERGELGRYKVLTRWASYHGNTLGALAASGHIGRRRLYRPLLNDDAFLHFAPCTHADQSCECLAGLEALIEREGSDSVAALIVEVVGGSAFSGFVPPAGYLPALEALCRRYGVLFIVDEVMTGMGRTGQWWAHDHESLHPDLMILAKGLSSGYSPLGAVVAQPRVWQTIHDGTGRFAHGLTYGGNPVSAAAGVAVMELMDAEHLVANARELGQSMRDHLERIARHHPSVTAVRGRGLMQGLVLQAMSPTPGATAATLAEKAFLGGLLIYPGSGSSESLSGDHVLVAPPLSIDESGITELMQKLDVVLSACESHGSWE